MKNICFCPLSAMVILLVVGAATARADDGPVLFFDSFEATVTTGNTAYTTPPVFSVGANGAAGGQLVGPVALGAGMSGQGALFTGQSQIIYQPATGNIDPSGGSLDFWVQLHFDPAESNERTRTVLRNQTFVNIWDTKRGYSNVGIYNAGKDVYAVCVMNADRNIVFYKNFRQVWQPGQWHHIKLTWGTEMALWCDGEKKASGPFVGLFGPVDFDLDTTRIYLGTHIGYSGIESEFTLDELTIRGPAQGMLSRRPRVTLPLLSAKPNLDGKIDDAFWRDACLTQGFMRFTTDEAASRQPQLYAAYTNEGLWLAARVALEPGVSPRAVLSERDAAIYAEDAVEFFFQPKGMPAGDYNQFMVSAAAARFDMAQRDGKPNIGYNPHWTCAATGVPGQWETEAFIPFDAFDLAAPPQPGDVWKAQFCIDSSAGFSSAATWASIAKNFGDPLYFGELVFSGEPRALRQEVLGGLESGDPLVTFNLAGDFQPIITVTGEVTDSRGSSVYRNSLRLRDTKSIDLRPPTLTTGRYLMTTEGVDESGRVVFYQTLRFETAKAFDVTVRTYPYAGYAQFHADTRGISESVEQVLCTVTAPDGSEAGVVTIDVAGSGNGDVHFPIADLTPGIYAVSASVQSADGKTLDTADRVFELFARPMWWTNDLGVDHTVPPPWTPVRESRDGLSVWGRDCAFDATVFPNQILNQGVNMFAAAPTMKLTSEGNTTDLATIAISGKTVFDDAVTLSGATQAGRIRVDATTTMEFDGFIRCDVTLTPQTDPHATVRVDRFTLELPLTSDIGRFLMTSTGGASNIKAIEQAVNSAFLPYVWLGNDDMGLAWFAGSDQFWSYEPKRAISVDPASGAVTLRIHFITKPITLDAPATYSFGIMASPVRPIPVNDPFAYPSWSAPASVTFAESLRYPVPAALAESDSGTLEFFVKRSETPSVDNADLLHIGADTGGVNAYLSKSNQSNRLVLLGGDDGKQTLLSADLPANIDRFTHLALVWSGGTLLCYADGALVASGTSGAAQSIIGALNAEAAHIRLGSVNPYYGYTGIVVDELRISTTTRYHGERFTVPDAPVGSDAHSLIVDHFEDTFRPDGQDAWTAAGGVPSIGCTFVDGGKFGRALRIHVAPARPGLEVLRDAGVKIVSDWAYQKDMVACWGQPILFADDVTLPGARETLKGWRQYGINLIPYLVYPAISSTSGLIERYGDEWQILPVSITPWQIGANPPPNYHFLNTCVQARGYADYLVGGAAWAMDDLGYDGFYSDGITNISACRNEAHGCGYRDREGHLHSTYPFFADRELMKRMYRTVKSRNPDGVIVNHCSFNLMLPILSFSDVVYTGEHEDYENMLTARLRFSSKPWGLYVTLLGGSAHIYSPLHAMSPLLSGTSVFGSGMVARNDFGRKDWAIRDAYRDFGTTDATWVPWWEGEAGPCRSDDPKVKVSFYYHPGESVLLLAGNFNADDTTATIRLDLASCGLSGRMLTARNVLTDQTIAVSADGTLSPMIRGKSFVLLRIE